MGRTCDTAPVVLHLIPVHANLVTANDGLQAVLLTESFGNVWTELHTDTTLARPATLLFLRVGPEHLHHETSLARLALIVPVELANVVEGDFVVGEETTVEDEVLLADQSCQR